MKNLNPNSNNTDLAYKIFTTLVNLFAVMVGANAINNDQLWIPFAVLLVLGVLLLVMWALRYYQSIGRGGIDQANLAARIGSGAAVSEESKSAVADAPKQVSTQPGGQGSEHDSTITEDPSAGAVQPPEVGTSEPARAEDTIPGSESAAVSFAEKDFSEIAGFKRLDLEDVAEDESAGSRSTDFTFSEDDFLKEEEEDRIIFTDLDIPAEPDDADARKQASSFDDDEDDDSGLIEFDVSDFTD